MKVDIKEQLIEGHTAKNSMEICEYSLSDKKRFEELMECFVSKEYRIAQRAAAVLRLAVTKVPGIIRPYIKDLIDQLPRKDVHNAVIRNTVRILQQIEIPEEFHGHVITNCFSFIEDPATPVAIKAFSLTTLNNLAKFYPEIKKELKLIIEERFETETAAFKSRAKKILSSIDS